MKRTAFFWMSVMLCVFAGSGALWAGDTDTKQIPSCKYCGMDREMFAQSRMLIEYDDGTTVGMCSLHCAALDLAVNMDKQPKSIRVADYGTRNMINAETAIWVIGGNKPGVMTKNAKWGFAKKEDADKFMQEHGGTVGTFDDALNAAYKDINDDTKMIREKRKMKRMHMHAPEKK